MSNPDFTNNVMQGAARALDEFFEKNLKGRTKFSLFVWQGDPSEDTGRANYVSNCDREDVREALTEVLSRWDQPHYKRQ